jgi:cytochrome c-type biogenesis protein CcmE
MLAFALLGLCTATALALLAFQDNLRFFYAPSDVVERGVAPGQRIRLGGLVEEGSVQRQADGRTIAFTITDLAAERRVVYTGALPDLFREGQGVVAEGSLRPDGVFAASAILAKHDETYMPREVADALKRAGTWRGGEAEAAEGGGQ